ncbi:pirin family protein [Myxococcus virescens]|uniref:pirin family protein n=1 Tax=Myxococcus virescens TaxID=83456 RepID=UPI003DA2D539
MTLGLRLATRRTFLLGGSALFASACSRTRSRGEAVPNLKHRALDSLPTTTLSWLTLRDHFVATVGARAGEGHPLGSLLVLADATFSPRSRFPLHPHREMEILSIVLNGDLSHHGDQAHGATVSARSAQLISARDGMVHAEGNDTDAPTRMLQIWFEPTSRGGTPAYFHRSFAERGRHLLAGDTEMPLRADARVWWHDLEPGTIERLSTAPQRRGYLLAMTSPLHVVAAGDPARAIRLEMGEGLVVEGGAVDLSADIAGAALWLDIA